MSWGEAKGKGKGAGPKIISKGTGKMSHKELNAKWAVQGGKFAEKGKVWTKGECWDKLYFSEFGLRREPRGGISEYQSRGNARH